MYRFFLVLALAPLLGCGGAGTTDAAAPEPIFPDKPAPETPLRRVILDQEAGTALLQLYSDGFEELPLKDRILAWHLYRASVAGRDIVFDQHHRHALTIRNMLDLIQEHPEGAPPKVLYGIQRYALRFWMNNGPFNTRTKAKFVPEVSHEDFLDALGAAAGAAGVDAGAMAGDWNSLRLFLFDPKIEPLLTNKNPPPGGDILLDSANNFYHGVSTRDLNSFAEKHPLNSRLVKTDKGLEEQVYRVGRGDVPAGRQAAAMAAVCGHLRAALPYAEGKQKAYLEALIDYFETGAPEAFDRASIAWLQTDSSVDLILGFIETYTDARGAKGEWEGLVTFKDAETTRVMKVIAENAQHFEDAAPWDDDYKKKWTRTPVANAVTVLVGVGHAGPELPLGINLPNSQAIREEHGSKSVYLTNVAEGIRTALADRSAKEFVPPAERKTATRFQAETDRLMVALHEVVGHGSGKASEKLSGDPSSHLKETYSTLEEARAELVALVHIADPLFVKQQLLSSPAAATEALRIYLRRDLLQLRRVPDAATFEDDHMRARHLIVEYLRLQEDCVALQKIDGKRYLVLTDVEKARQHLRDLLAEVMRIKAEGDYEEARKLVDTYAVRFDTDLRDEIVRRAVEARIPRFYKFHMPGLEVKQDDKGVVTDVRLDYGRDFSDTMLAWDRGKGY